MITIDLISDLHGEEPILEGGDLLIVAGDLTSNDSFNSHSDFLNWIHKQNYKKKVVIAGNHDMLLQENKKFYSKSREDVVYLCDSGTEFEGLKIWGSPWSVWFQGINPRCTAFTGSESELLDKFSLIHEDVDILVTHTPPFGILDAVKPRYPRYKYDNFGSHSLRHYLYEEKIKPKLHVFGHIHDAHGEVSGLPDYPYTHFVNAAQLDEDYIMNNKPIRVIL